MVVVRGNHKKRHQFPKHWDVVWNVNENTWKLFPILFTTQENYFLNDTFDFFFKNVTLNLIAATGPCLLLLFFKISLGMSENPGLLRGCWPTLVCWKVLGLLWDIFRLMMCQIFSVGERSSPGLFYYEPIDVIDAVCSLASLEKDIAWLGSDVSLSRFLLCLSPI